MLKASTHGPITYVRLARTFMGRPLYLTGAYLVGGLLIDTGCPATAKEMVGWCRGRGVERVVNTHHHEDHAGGNNLLARDLGMRVFAPEAAIPMLRDPIRLQFYRWLVWGQPKPFEADPLGNQVETDGYRFEVISTPGHCPDHVCLFEPERGWLFGGDLFLHEQVRYLRADEDVVVSLESLRKALELRPKVLFCAHAGPVEDACGALERKIAYWEGVREDALRLRETGLTIGQISERLLGPEGMLAQVTRGHFSKLNLIRSLVGEEV